jgi:UDP-2-acetamido-3-amino-2,3-dideoxy-glucuronate N-acetyltransferase
MSNDTNIIAANFRHGKNFKIGHHCIIEEGVEVGDDVTIGNFCVLNKDVKIGSGTRLMHYVELRSDTIIGERCYVDSNVSSSGACKVGDEVTLRYGAILARGVEIGDKTYVCPRVMTNNLDTHQDQIGGAKIGPNCFIGTHSVIQHGIKVVGNVIVGSMSFVNRDILESGTYVGIPAKKLEKKK